MRGGQWARAVVRILDSVAGRFSTGEISRAEHLRIGARGEEDAYFQLRRMGYVIVARNYRSPRCHGEIDLIGWEGDILFLLKLKREHRTK